MSIKKILVTPLLALLLTNFIVQASENIDTFSEKALIAFQNDKFPTTIILLKNILQESADHMPSRVLMAQVLIAQGNGGAAEVELNRARAGNVDNDRLITLYGQAYLLQDKYDDAL